MIFQNQKSFVTLALLLVRLQIAHSAEVLCNGTPPVPVPITDVVMVPVPQGQRPIVGFNIGFPNLAFVPNTTHDGVQWVGKDGNYRGGPLKAINRAIADGFKDFRINDALSRDFVFSDGKSEQFTTKMVVDIVRKLVSLGANSVMLVMDSYPLKGSERHRTPPQGSEKALYQDRLRQIIQALNSAKVNGVSLLSKTRFELFNEPNAPDFFDSEKIKDFRTAVQLALSVLSDEKVPNNQIKCCAFTSNFMQVNSKSSFKGNSRESLLDFLFNLRVNYPNTPSSGIPNGIDMSWHWYPRKGIAASAKKAIPTDIFQYDTIHGGMITEFNVDAWLSIDSVYGHCKNKSDNTGKWIPGYRESLALDQDFGKIFNYAAQQGITHIYLQKIINSKDAPNSGNVKIENGFFDSTGCPKWEYIRMLRLLGQDPNLNASLSPKCTDPTKDWTSDRPL